MVRLLRGDPKRPAPNTRLCISAGFIATLALVTALSEGTGEDVMLAGFLAVCAVVPLLIPRRKRTYASSDGTVRARAPTSWSVWTVFIIMEKHMPALKRLRLHNERMLARIVPATGTTFDIERAATVSTRLSLLLILPSAVLGAMAGMHIHFAFYGAAAVPLVTFFVPLVQLRFSVLERKTRIEEETAYFLCFVNTVQTVGMSLYMAFDSIRGKGIFPGIERDAHEIVKRVEMLGMTQNDSLDVYAKNHPSPSFAAFVSGYLSKIASVGDVPAYTESKAKFFFNEYIASWERYEKSAQEIFSAVIMIAILLPMMMAFNSIVGTGSSSGLMIMLGIIVSPVVSVVMISMLNSSQPATGNMLAVSYPSIAAGAGIGLTLAVAGVSIPTVIGLSAFVGALLNAIFTRGRMMEITRIDDMMPEFMQDVTEQSRVGSNVNQIVLYQSGKGLYARQFEEILGRLAAGIRSGMRMEEASRKIRTKSVNLRFILFLLSHVQSTGGGSSEIFLAITDFITKIQQTKIKISKGLGMLTIIVYASPFIMFGISQVMITMFSDAGSAPIGMTVDSDIPSAFGSVSDDVKNGIQLMTVMTTIPMGVVAAKISRYEVTYSPTLGQILMTMPILIP